MLRGLLMAKTTNIGDDIQIWPLAKMWKGVDVVLSRDDFRVWWAKGEPIKSEPTRLIVSGWHTYSPGSWPPPSYIQPLFISLHIWPRVKGALLRGEVVEYLSRFEVGARDWYTYRALADRGVRSYFSGCASLLVGRFWERSCHERGDLVLFVDVPGEIMGRIPKDVMSVAVEMSQLYVRPWLNKAFSAFAHSRSRELSVPRCMRESYSALCRCAMESFLRGSLTEPFARLTAAGRRIGLLARARLIITSRLHVALPAASLGVPVIFVHRNLADERFEGLIDLVNAFNREEFLDVAGELDYFGLTNPNQTRLRELQDGLMRRLEAFIAGDGSGKGREG
ncbi:MAG: hypothetical protein KatS3mg082_3415 [Nitrospiraceae bacterium]|nr:MAG: hypothetical protein KatS3mg082_3415 [Nitrospiraceae bacterium]